MTKRKHRGGGSDRHSPHPAAAGPRADTAPFGSPSRTGKPRFGKPGSGRSAIPDKSGPGKSGPGKFGVGKPRAGLAASARPSADRHPDERPWGKRPQGARPAGTQRTWSNDGRPKGFRPRAGGPRDGNPSDGRPAEDLRPANAKIAKPRPSRGKVAAPPDAVAGPQHEASAERPIRRPSHGGPRQVWLYGLHAVRAALANPRRQRHRLVLSDEAAETLRQTSGDMAGGSPAALGPAEILPRETIARLLPPGAVHQGAALLTDPLGDIALEEVLDAAAGAETALLLVLDQVTDPQNVGAILRSAAAFGAAAVIVPDRHAPPETGALVKAASGAIEVVPLVRVINLARALDHVKEAGFWCAGLEGRAPQTLAAADLSGKVALVLGAEGEGLRRLTRDHCDILVRLPISERIESLNVSAAAAVALYELARKA